MPLIYKFGNGSPVIILLAGSHGNEPAPCHYLYQLIKSGKLRNFSRGTVYVIPYVNLSAILKGDRSVFLHEDVNRSWDNSYIIKINKYLEPILLKADLIVDFHEGYDYHSCNKKSIGQSIFTTDKMYVPLITKLVNVLNKSVIIPEKSCAMWVTRVTDKKIIGSLKEWSVNRNIPYILVEIAGQNDIVPMNMRMLETKIIVDNILNLDSHKIENFLS